MIKKIIMVVASIIVVFAIVIGIGLSQLINDAKTQVEAFNFEEIDMQSVSNGVYEGASAAGSIVVEVAVKVANHAITEIEIRRHENGLGSKAESITADMVTKNTYAVDAVSGATYSSEVIKHAVYQALSKGLA